MNKYQAEQIINKYGSAIANNKGVFRRESSLPCSKDKIRYAFQIYIQAIINNSGELTQEIGENLVTTYSILDSFIPDGDIDRLNKIAEQMKNKELNTENPEDKKQIDEWFLLSKNALCNGGYVDEINRYIGECYRQKARSLEKNKTNKNGFLLLLLIFILPGLGTLYFFQYQQIRTWWLPELLTAIGVILYVYFQY